MAVSRVWVSLCSPLWHILSICRAVGLGGNRCRPGSVLTVVRMVVSVLLCSGRLPLCRLLFSNSMSWLR